MPKGRSTSNGFASSFRSYSGINSDGELFLQKRAHTKDVNPGLWDTSAAGHVDFGESYEDSARRELKEELGIDYPEQFEPLFKMEASVDTGWEFIQVYQLTYDGVLQPEPHEIIDGRWFGLTELQTWIARGGEGLTPSFQLLWAKFCSI